MEVKSLTLGEVTRNTHDEVVLEQISTFSRLLDAERFAEAALVDRLLAGRLARAVWKVPTRWSWKHGSKALACAGLVTMSIRCWSCAMPCAIGAGRRPGRAPERSASPVALSVGASTVSSAWSMPVGPSSIGRGCTSGRTCWSKQRLNLWRRSIESHRLLVWALAILGVSPFSDGLLLPRLLLEGAVQKNETHPFVVEHS